MNSIAASAAPSRVNRGRQILLGTRARSLTPLRVDRSLVRGSHRATGRSIKPSSVLHRWRNAASPSPVWRPRESPSQCRTSSPSSFTPRPTRERVRGIRPRPPPGESPSAGDHRPGGGGSSPDDIQGIVVRDADPLPLHVVRLRVLRGQLPPGERRDEAVARPDPPRRRPPSARGRQCLQCVRERRHALRGDA